MHVTAADARLRYLDSDVPFVAQFGDRPFFDVRVVHRPKDEGWVAILFQVISSVTESRQCPQHVASLLWQSYLLQAGCVKMTMGVFFLRGHASLTIYVVAVSTRLRWWVTGLSLWDLLSRHAVERSRSATRSRTHSAPHRPENGSER
jgi:hypothetical protein